MSTRFLEALKAKYGPLDSPGCLPVPVHIWKDPSSFRLQNHCLLLLLLNNSPLSCPCVTVVCSRYSFQVWTMWAMKTSCPITQQSRSPSSTSCLSASSCTTLPNVRTFYYLDYSWEHSPWLTSQHLWSNFSCLESNKPLTIAFNHSLDFFSIIILHLPLQPLRSHPETPWRHGRRRTTPGWSSLTSTERQPRTSESLSSPSTWAWG